MDLNIDNNYMEMQEALQSQNSSINVQNTNSDLNRFYHMNVPFQLTLEYCSGSELEDYINIMTLSAEKSLMYQESAATKNFARTKDVMHYHDFFEFVIVLEGSIVQKIEGKDYLYAAGTCCLINRSLCHLEHYHAKTKVLFIGMSPDFILELFRSAQTSTFTNEKKICKGSIYQFIMEDLKTPGQKAYLDFIPAYQNHKNALHLHDLAQSMIQTMLYTDLLLNRQSLLKLHQPPLKLPVRPLLKHCHSPYNLQHTILLQLLLQLQSAPSNLTGLLPLRH